MSFIISIFFIGLLELSPCLSHLVSFTHRIQSPEACLSGYNHRFSYMYEQPSAVMLEYFLMKSYLASTIKYTKLQVILQNHCFSLRSYIISSCELACWVGGLQTGCGYAVMGDDLFLG